MAGHRRRPTRSAYTLIEPIDQLRASLTCRRFFTLVELLVVVSIIALLAAMLLPSLNRARERARIAVCQSNQRQSDTALLSYAADDGEFATIVDWNQTLDWQGKPNNWYASVTLAGSNWQVAADGTGYGGPSRALLVALHYLTGMKVTKCTALAAGTGWYSAGWWATTNNFCHYASPGTCGSALVDYGHDSARSTYHGLYHQHHWADSPRGYSFRTDKRAPVNFALITGRGFLMAPGGSAVVIDPHGARTPEFLGGAHQFDHTWPHRARNDDFADGHVEFSAVP